VEKKFKMLEKKITSFCNPVDNWGIKNDGLKELFMSIATTSASTTLNFVEKRPQKEHNTLCKEQSSKVIILMFMSNKSYWRIYMSYYDKYASLLTKKSNFYASHVWRTNFLRDIHVLIFVVNHNIWTSLL